MIENDKYYLKVKGKNIFWFRPALGAPVPVDVSSVQHDLVHTIMLSVLVNTVLLKRGS
jgi:hypothetical protein